MSALDVTSRNVKAIMRIHGAAPGLIAALVILGLPLLTFAAFPTKLVQFISVDPWIYFAYIHDFAATTARFGMTYYGNRIAYIFAAKAFVKLFGDIGGYLAFAYVALVAAAAAVYSIANRFYGVRTALLTVSWLCLLPWLPRSIFWTHYDGVATIYLLIAIALLIAPVRLRLPAHALAGVAFALAVNCNLLLLAIGLTFAPGWIYLNRTQGIRWICFAVLLITSAFFATYLGLGVGMRIASSGRLPFFFDVAAVRISMSMMADKTSTWFVPLHALVSDPEHYYLLVPPTFLCAIGVVVLRSFRCPLWRRVELRSPLPVFAASHLALVILLALILHVLFEVAWLAEYYYVIYFLPGCVLSFICVVGEGGSLSRRRILSVMILCLSVGLLLVLVEWPKFIYEIPRVRLSVWCSLAGITIIAALIARRSAILNMLLIVLLFGSSLVFYAASQYSALIRPTAKIRELLWDQYGASLFLLHYVNSNVPTGTPVRFWYRSQSPETTWLDSVQSTFLWQFTRVAPFNAKGPGMPIVNAAFYKNVSGAGSLILLGDAAAELDTAEAALLAAEVPFEEVKRSKFVGKRVSLYVAILYPKLGSQERSLSLDTTVRDSGAVSLEPSVDGLAFRSGPVPWSYVAQMPLLAGCVHGSGWVAVNVQITRGTVGVGVLNRKTDAFMASGSAGTAKRTQTILLWVDSFSSAADLILRNWDEASSSEGILKAVQVDAKSGPTPPACDPDPVRTRAFSLARSLPLSAMVPASKDAHLQLSRTGLAFTSAPQPWSYIGRTPLLADCFQGGGWIAADLRVTRGAIGVGVLNRKGDGFLVSRTPTVSSKSQTIYLRLESFADAGDLVVRNWDKRESSEGILESVRVAAESGSIAACHSIQSSSEPPSNAVEITGVFGGPVLPGSATKLQGSIQQISTPRQPWGYAAQFPLQRRDLNGPLWVRVRAIVHGAAVGIGVLNEKGTAFLARDMVNPGDSTVTLRVLNPASMGDLVIQSWANGTPAEAKIESISVLAAPS